MQTSIAKISDDYILDLIKKQRNFDKGFRLLMEKYQERIYWHIRRMVYDHEDANDVVQNPEQMTISFPIYPIPN